MLIEEQFRKLIESITFNYMEEQPYNYEHLRIYNLATIDQINEIINFINQVSCINNLSIMFSSHISDNLISQSPVIIADFLKKNTNLHELKMSGEFIDDNFIDVIANALESNTNLQSIKLPSNGISYEGICNIAYLLQSNTYLKEIEVSQNDNIGNLGCMKIVDALRANSVLRVLNLSNDQISNEGVAGLADALQFNSSLQVLALGGNKIGNEGAIKLGEMLKTNNALQTLCVTENPIDGVGGKAIAEALLVNRFLKTLSIAENYIGDEGASSIGDVLRVNSTLENLFMEKDDISDEGAVRLGQGLKMNRFLRKLDLYDNQIGDKGASSIGEALRINSSLQELNLNGNEIGSVGAIAVVDALKVNSTLRDLDIGTQKISNEGVAKFAEVLPVNRSLKILHLIESEIAEEGAISIAQGLKANCGLDKLYLEGNEIGEVGASHILSSLRVNSTLKVLDLSSNGIQSDNTDKEMLASFANNSLMQLSINDNPLGDEYGEIIAYVCKNMSALRYLNISRCGFSSEGIIRILEILKDSQSLSSIYIGKDFNFTEKNQENLVKVLQGNIILIAITSSNNSGIDFILQRNKGFIYQIANKLKSVDDVDKLACNPLWFVKSCAQEFLLKYLFVEAGKELARNIFDRVQTKKIITVEELMMKLGVCKNENSLWESENSLIIFPPEIISKIFIEAFPRLRKCLESKLRWESISISKRKSEDELSGEAKKNCVENEEVTSLGEVENIEDLVDM